jgi:hypothetical protein
MVHFPFTERTEFIKRENLSTPFYKKPYGGVETFIRINETSMEVT